MITWYAGRPSHFVRTLSDSMTMFVPSMRTSVASAGLVAASSSLREAMRSSVSSSESGWMNCVSDSPRYSFRSGTPTKSAAALLAQRINPSSCTTMPSGLSSSSRR